MSTLLMLCGLSVTPCVTLADPADLPNENLAGNSATRPNGNLPGSVRDDHRVQRPANWAAPRWWPFQPTAGVPRHEPPPEPTPERADAIAALQRQLEAARARSGVPTLHPRPSAASQQQTP
jgi:hypothetical protein